MANHNTERESCEEGNELNSLRIASIIGLVIGLSTMFVGWQWSLVPYVCSCPTSHPNCCPPPPLYGRPIVDQGLFFGGIIIVIVSLFGLLLSRNHLHTINREKNQKA
jgi:hypothetical protein